MCLCSIYDVYIFVFQLTEMVSAIVRDVATFRFEHEQSSGVSSGYLLEEIVILKSKQNEVEEHMKKLLDYLTNLHVEFNKA